MNSERDDDEVDHQRPHGDLPVGNDLCQQLADRKPETQPERVQDHEEHPEPVDQDALTGHIAPFSRATTLTKHPSTTTCNHPRRAILTTRRPLAGQSPGADGLAHRPGSVRRTASRRHGWRPSISGCRCRQPPATYPRARADRPRTLAVWSCSRWGLPSHDGLPPRWWSLAPPFHPYLRSEDRRRSVFCGTDPAGCPGWVLPTTSSCGARTFLDTSRLPAR